MDRKILSIVFAIATINTGSSQYGFQSMGGFNYFNENTSIKSIQPSNSMHYSIGPSYWFRLSNVRIEFNPSVLFDYNKSNYAQNDLGVTSLSEQTISFNMPILIYPMDFGNDCHCPTFNKGGQFFEKGFYFLIYPALPYSSKKINGIDSSYSKSFSSFQLGLGAGIDIGLSKKWTLSPAIVVSKFFKDAYSLTPDKLSLTEDGDSRYRIDLMVRLIWFEKNKR